MKSLPMSELSSRTSGHQNCCWCIVSLSFFHVHHPINVAVPGFHGSQTLCPVWIHNFRWFTYISRPCFTWLLLSPHLTPIALWGTTVITILQLKNWSLHCMTLHYITTKDKLGCTLRCLALEPGLLTTIYACKDAMCWGTMFEKGHTLGIIIILCDKNKDKQVKSNNKKRCGE